jgi:Heparinase II/III-like protein/Heparinase II/III N-terminus/Polysaccharide deacetylase
MVPRLKGPRSATESRRPKRRIYWGRLALEISLMLGISAVFAFKILGYADPSAVSLSSVRQTFSLAAHNAEGVVDNLPELHHCTNGLSKHDVPGGYVCATGPSSGLYSHIYRSYPLVGDDRESIYSDVDAGSVSAANDLLQNKFDVPRYKPFQLSGSPTWSENPYSADYWRLEYYSLRPSLNLLYAYRKTGKTAYSQKTTDLDLSFISAEPRSRWAWSDPSAVAFRSMTLVDTWWKLRQEHQLSEATSTAFLGELEKTGQFLADPNHYQQENNHCVNEAAALYELAVAFPDLPHASQWLSLAKERFQWQLDGLIDSDGQLIENSPYYEFYALSKYWQIYDYSLAHNAPINPDFHSKLMSMVNFATYILQPNDQVPLLGASTEETIHNHGLYQAMTRADPQFDYALTRGEKGTQPKSNSTYFKASGLTVMRSGWPKGPTFSKSTYLTYNIGRYRTAHSDLDALAITLYGAGGDLLPGAGLYTYNPGTYHNYFHGTASENTVVVDGKSQVQGDGTGTSLKTIDGITFQSAESSLYDGVDHRRLVAMIDPSHILVVDQLNSASAHTYQQMFHLFPGAQLSKSGLTVSGSGGSPDRKVTIQQLQPAGISESDVINQSGGRLAGLCSAQYNKLEPCYAVSYTVHGRTASFYTMITIGPARSSVFSAQVQRQGGGLRVVDGQDNVTIRLGRSAAVPARAWATDPTPPAVPAAPVVAASTPDQWSLTGGDANLSHGPDRSDGNAVVTRVSTDTSSRVYLNNKAVRLDLVHHNARLRMRVDGLSRLSSMRLTLLNGDGSKSVTKNLMDAYTRTFSGNWADIFIGPSAKWGPNGGWLASGTGFDWSKIDGMQIEVDHRSDGGLPSTVSIGGVSLVPAQPQAKLVFVFDDGYQSILPAASYMHQNKMPGNVAVIGKYVDYPTQDHLNLYQLRQLQNAWGWNMVNHTQKHADAVATYSDQNDLSGYQTDILQQASWLEKNRLNSAPNWLVYPHGSTNNELQSVVGKYYMFARVTTDNPDAYPYGNPLAVSDFEIQYPGDEGDGGSAGLTSPAEVHSVVQQAIANHSTIILTFHRINSEPADGPGYPLALFKQIVNGIHQSGIKVLTLSQLDQSNGVSVANRIHYVAAQPSQITVHFGK